MPLEETTVGDWPTATQEGHTTAHDALAVSYNLLGATVAGTRDSGESALANLLTALDTAGIIVDTTTAS